MTSKDTLGYNRRVGERLKMFREIRKLTQTDIALPLGYKSSGAWSLIESGDRGLNKTKIAHAAKLLNTYPEVLTADQSLTKEELIDLDKFLHIRTNPKHPQYKEMLKFMTVTT